MGSSYLPSDLVAGVLLAQLEAAEAITAARLNWWHYYHNNWLTRSTRDYCAGQSYLMKRSTMVTSITSCSLVKRYAFVPLHSAPAGRRYGRAGGAMTVTDHVAGDPPAASDSQRSDRARRRQGSRRRSEPSLRMDCQGLRMKCCFRCRSNQGPSERCLAWAR